MAKGIHIFGQVRGKLGGMVLYRANGEQISRAKAASVKNPKTSGQMIQRLLFATVAAAYARMKSITDHSFEGVQYGAKSQQKFMSENLKRLRAFYPTSADAEALAKIAPVDVLAYAAKGDPGDSGAGLIISLGSLGEVPVLRSTDGVATGFGGSMTTNTIANVLKVLGAEIGDQITVVALTTNGVGVQFRKSRYVIDDAITAEQLASPWNGEIKDGMDKTKSVLSDIILVPGGEEGLVIPKAAGRTVIAAGVILSRRGSGDKWLRSRAILYNWQSEGPDYSAQYALPTWEYNGTDIETVNDRYLNNADASGE